MEGRSGPAPRAGRRPGRSQLRPRCRAAGLPPTVVARAKSVLARLEAGRAKTGGLAAGLDDLPLFAAITEPARLDPLRAALDATDPDALNAREALDLIYRLKAIAAEKGSDG